LPLSDAHTRDGTAITHPALGIPHPAMSPSGTQKPYVIILADSAVEIIPRDLWSHPAVTSYCRRRGRSPARTLLDSSYHYSAMMRLPGRERRGRPDILHFTLLEVLGSPLNKAGKLEIYIHTQTGLVIEVNPEVRLPRNYDRFKSLLAKLLVEGVIESSNGEPLLRVLPARLAHLRERLGKAGILLLSERGRMLDLETLSRLIKDMERLIIVVGCFPHGDFSGEVRSMRGVEARISDYTLESWVAASRILCLLESLERG